MKPARAIFSVFLIFLYARISFCLYKDAENVQTVDTHEKLNDLLAKEKIIVVHFYATWCRVSRGFVNNFIKIANTLKDDATFIAIKDENISTTYKVESYPSLKIFFTKGNTKTNENFSGNYNIKEVVSFIYESIKNYRLKELNIYPEKKKNSYKKKSKDKIGKVITLNDNNFNQNVLKNHEEVWFVLFYAPWCGHCKSMHPIFDELAQKVSHLKNAKIAKIDATVEVRSAQEYKIKHYPSLILFPFGKKSSSVAVYYNEQRDIDNLYQFFLKYYVQKKEVIQLTSQEVFEENCDSGVCLLAILPNKEDTSSKYFISYIDILNEIAKEVNQLPVMILWIQAGEQLDMIQKLNLTFGFPTTIALNLSKNVYSVLKGNYSKQSIKNFITQMMTGKVTVENIIPFTIKNTSPFSLNSLEQSNEEL